MKTSNSVTSIGYRTKGPDGDVKTCALAFSGALLKWFGSERLSVTVHEPVGSKWFMSIQAAPDGYLIDVKRGSVQGEINVAWNLLRAAPPTAFGKGRLPCRREASGLLVDISSWIQREDPQEVLFESWGRVLKP